MLHASMFTVLIRVLLLISWTEITTSKSVSDFKSGLSDKTDSSCTSFLQRRAKLELKGGNLVDPESVIAKFHQSSSNTKFGNRNKVLKKHVVIFEAPGGSDKGPDGHRKDTLPILNALVARGWTAEVIFYTDSARGEIYQRVQSSADAFVCRVNPGTIEGGEDRFFDMLRDLNSAGCVAMNHPDAMMNYGSKDALVKLRGTGLVPSDTYAYYSLEELKVKFPSTLALGRRVLKQNRGCVGEGVWLVSVDDSRWNLLDDRSKSVPLDMKVKCVEAFDNHVESHQLSEMMKLFQKYIVGEHGMLVDMPYLPRIREGEIRILLVGTSPIFIVHKKPADEEDAFSATLFSGATYRYDEPSKWPDLVDWFINKLPDVINLLGNYDIPLIWTADFILDTNEDGSDKYVLSEINCSCPGFTTHLDHGIQEKIADEIIRRLEM